MRQVDGRCALRVSRLRQLALDQQRDSVPAGWAVSNTYRSAADTGPGLTSPLPTTAPGYLAWRPGAGHVIIRTAGGDADRGRVEEHGQWFDLQFKDVVFDVRKTIAISDYLVAVPVAAIGAMR